MTILNIEVGQENYLESIGDNRVSIDHLGDGVDKLDDQLGHMIPGRGLAAKNDRTGCFVSVPRAAPERVIQRDEIQHVQMLAFVLVQSLYLDVEERRWIYNNARSFLITLARSRLLSNFTALPCMIETQARSASGSRPARAPLLALLSICRRYAL